MTDNTIYALGLQAKIVTLNKSYTATVAQCILDCRSSVEANSYAGTLDLGKDTHSYASEYYVITSDKVYTYEAAVFMVQVEPRLILGE